MARILIIDDDAPVATALQAALRTEGNHVEIATDADRGLRQAEREDFDVVITDLHWVIPGSKRREAKGLEIIDQLHRGKPALPIILMTAYPATDTTIRATGCGAYDYIAKPGTPKEMNELVKTVHKAASLALAARQSAATAGPAQSFPPSETMGLHRDIRGKSRGIQTVLKQIGRVAAKPVTVLICGETGTGKELVARALHEHSGRANQPFIIVNCVAIPESLLESELFGHEAGSFTGATTRRVGRFEQANGGTIFLDEIGDMVPNTQAKLLRVLQDRVIQRLGAKESFTVDVRVIAATHRDLESAVEKKQFRADLYYRLNDAVIRLPPLRDRKEDIPELVDYFRKQHAEELGATGSEIDSSAIAHLQHHSWPGNVRELGSVIRKALLQAGGRRIDAAVIRKMLDETTSFFRAAPGKSLAGYVSEMLNSAERDERTDVAEVVLAWAEREIITQAFRLVEGDQTKAAQLLGISRPTLRDKLMRYEIRLEPEAEPQASLA